MPGRATISRVDVDVQVRSRIDGLGRCSVWACVDCPYGSRELA